MPSTLPPSEEGLIEAILPFKALFMPLNFGFHRKILALFSVKRFRF